MALLQYSGFIHVFLLLKYLILEHTLAKRNKLGNNDTINIGARVIAIQKLVIDYNYFKFKNHLVYHKF